MRRLLLAIFFFFCCAGVRSKPDPNVISNGQFQTRIVYSTYRKLPQDFSSKVRAAIDHAHSEIGSLYGTRRKKIRARIIFLDPEFFSINLALPGWTSAVYIAGTVYISMTPQMMMFPEVKLKSSLVHELTHALVANYSNSRAPAWIDEGLAQMAERSEVDVCYYMKPDAYIPLKDLEAGWVVKFATGEEAGVAYSEGLIATRLLDSMYGRGAIMRYLKLLGQEDPRAFENAFDNLTLQEFEALLKLKIEFSCYQNRSGALALNS